MPEPDALFSEDSFSLLAELMENNNRAWYHEHKKLIKLDLIDPLAYVLEQASQALKRTRPPLKGGRNTMFRLNRDTRFSKNKQPYKENVSGLLTPSGLNGQGNGLVYLHFDTEGGFMGAGFYRADARRLEPIRQRMVDQPKQWQSVRNALFKAGLDLDRDNALKSMPRGFSQYTDHQHADDIKLKSLIVSRSLSKRAWLDGTVVDRLIAFAKQAAPLIRFGG
ncbi:MAG: DUF2461 domain-containing protein [Pseudomonadota bacterium]